MNPMQAKIIAIDVSKKTLETLRRGRLASLANEPSSHRRIARMALEDRAIVAFEASGGYERPLMEALQREGAAAVLLNPGHVRAYAASKGIKAKTDAIDVQVIASFVAERRPGARPAQPQARQRMADLLDRRSQLAEHLAREKARLDKCPKLIAGSIRKMIRVIEKEIAAIEAKIAKVADRDEQASLETRAMQAVKGVGKVTAWSAFAYLPDLASISRSRLSSLAGLAPFNQDSGDHRGRRSIAAGKRKVRRPLYMAATSAISHNDHIRAFYQRLQSKGKAHNVALVACMRKLLIHLQSEVRKAHFGLD